MKKFAEQLKKKAEAIKLRSDEHDALRARLLAYMEYHPLTDGQQVLGKRLADRKLSFYERLHSGWFVGRLSGLVAVFILLVVPALAEQALPGDVLYPVKVRFNEELRGALASDPYQKIEWETSRLERRVAEAKLLADAGKLTPDAEADVANAILSHSAAAQENIDSIRVSDKDEAAFATINLASALDVSAEVLSKKEASTDAPDTSALVSAVSEARAAVHTDREDASYQKLMSRIELETTRAYEYLDSVSATTTEENRDDLEKRLTDIDNKIKTAAETQEVDEAAASKLLVEALGNTRKLISFMTNLDVRRNVRINDLVPSTPSGVELRLVLEKRLKETDTIMKEVEEGTEKLATTSSNYIELKEGIEYYEELQKTAEQALTDDDLPGAETAASSAAELAKGLLDNLQAIGISINATSTAATSSEPQ